MAHLEWLEIDLADTGSIKASLWMQNKFTRI